MTPGFKPIALFFALLAIHTASAQTFLDLNSLQAFMPATTANDLSILSPDQSPLNGTSTTSAISPNPAYTFSNSETKTPSQYQDPNPRLDTNSPSTPLAKRQNSCGTFNSCANEGAPSLCCPTNQVCSADSLGRVGCCPSGAACTGQIPGAGGVVATATSLQSGGYTITSTAVTTTAETTVTGSGGFVLAGTETVAVLGSSGVVLRPVRNLPFDSMEFGTTCRC